MEKNTFRLRNKQINIRITDYEKEMILEKYKLSGKHSLREYLVEAAIKGYVINMDYKQIKELAYEMNRIGNNVNQIAHKVNKQQQPGIQRGYGGAAGGY